MPRNSCPPPRSSLPRRTPAATRTASPSRPEVAARRGSVNARRTAAGLGTVRPGPVVATTHPAPPVPHLRQVQHVDPLPRPGDGDPHTGAARRGQQPLHRLGPGVEGEVERRPVHRHQDVAPEEHPVPRAGHDVRGPQHVVPGQPPAGEVPGLGAGQGEAGEGDRAVPVPDSGGWCSRQGPNSGDDDTRSPQTGSTITRCPSTSRWTVECPSQVAASSAASRGSPAGPAVRGRVACHRTCRR